MDWFRSTWIYYIVFIRSKMDNLITYEEFQCVREDIRMLNQKLDDLNVGDAINELHILSGEVDRIKMYNSSNATTTTYSSYDHYRDEIARLESTIQAQQREINSLKNVIKDMLKKGSEHQTTNDTTTSIPLDIVNRVVTPHNSIFTITGNENVCVLGKDTTIDSVREYFNSAINVDEILDIVGSMSEPSSYDKVLLQFKRALTDDIRKFDYDADSVEELSENATVLVSKRVNSNIIEKIIDSIEKKVSNNSPYMDELKVLLGAINRYLSKLGYYTKNVNVGEVINGSPRSDMSICVEPCTDGRLFGTIKSVNRLPYYVNCYSDSSPIVCRGVYVVYTNRRNERTDTVNE